jgi:hypothetical protein
LLNLDLPPVECYVRHEFMRQHKDGHGETTPVVIFGMASIPGQTPLFHFLAPDGGIWWRMPMHAFCHKPEAQPLPLHEIALWDSFSYHPTVTRFALLTNKRMTYRSRSNVERSGRYLMTIDWAAPDGTGFAETPGQHKCSHLIELDDGNYALQPNNRVWLFEPSYTTAYRQPLVDRLVSNRVYTAEDQPRYILTDGESYETPTKDTANGSHDPSH